MAKNWIRSFVSHTVAAILGWALFSLIHSVLTSWMIKIGVVSQTAQFGFIAIGAAVLLFIVVGMKGLIKTLTD